MSWFCYSLHFVTLYWEGKGSGGSWCHLSASGAAANAEALNVTPDILNIILKKVNRILLLYSNFIICNVCFSLGT